MKIYNKQFLGADVNFSLENAKVIIVPIPYEGGVSYGKGTAGGPDAIIDASYNLELYDEYFDTEPYRIGICTIEPIEIMNNPESMIQAVYETINLLLKQDKFVVSIGGDHSITTGYLKALCDRYGSISVIQFDAHADLRDIYEGSKYSHACVMSRIQEMTQNTLQIGVRSLSFEESERIKNEKISVCTMNDYRQGLFNLESSLNKLPNPVFITFDVDVFDWSVVRSTGTPEPGGLLWDETISLLQNIFSLKKIVGFDVVELIGDKDDINSSFAVAKLIYKIIATKFFI